MVSTHTQDQLARLLRTIAKGESEIELLRQTIDRNSGFESYTGFKRIDRDCDNALSTAEVTAFLKEHFYTASDKDVRSLFNAYSGNGGTRITYHDFRKIVLSHRDYILNYKCLGRKVFAIYPDEFLYDEVEKALARILQKEIELLQRVEELKEDLSIRNDFGLVDVFNLIDEGKTGAITFDALYKFMKNNINSTQDDVIAIFCRFDKDKDQKLNYTEFSAIIQPVSSNYNVNLVSDAYKSPTRTRTSNIDQIGFTESLYLSPQVTKKYTNEDYHDYLRGTAHTNAESVQRSTFTSAFKDTEIQRNLFDSPSPTRSTKALDYSSPLKYTSNIHTPSVYLRDSVSPVREKESPISTKSTQKETTASSGFTKLKNNEKRDLARFLKDELDADKAVEKIKKELVLQRNFNVQAVFRLFDTTNKGYITRGQLETGLQTFNIFPSKNELYLLMRRLDKNEDGLIRFSEFAEELEPKQGEKTFSNTDAQADQEVGLGIRTVLRKLFNKMIYSETTCEELRKSIGQKEYFTMYESFQTIKRYATGWITASTFKDLLNDQGVYASDEDAELLLVRYDRNKNKKVSYSEFVDEIVSKLA